MWSYTVVTKGQQVETYRRYATAEEALRAGLAAADRAGFTPEAVIVSSGRTFTDLAFAQVGR
jgi:hypothetical protein